MSQTAIIEQNAITNQASRELKFPSKPPVSNEAKNFIKKCLTYNASQRPEVFELSTEEYLKPSTYRAKLISDTVSNHSNFVNSYNENNWIVFEALSVLFK